MNWDMLGAIGELVGAAGVILTLVYLARQMRKATAEDQRTRYTELTTEIAEVARGWAENDRLSDIMFRGFRDPACLKPPEMFRFYSSIFGAMRAWEAVWQYSQEEGVHDWGAEGTRATMASFFGLPGMQEYWVHRRNWFSAGFQAEVDRIMASTAERMDTAYGESPE